MEDDPLLKMQSTSITRSILVWRILHLSNTQSQCIQNSKCVSMVLKKVKVRAYVCSPRRFRWLYNNHPSVFELTSSLIPWVECNFFCNFSHYNGADLHSTWYPLLLSCQRSCGFKACTWLAQWESNTRPLNLGSNAIATWPWASHLCLCFLRRINKDRTQSFPHLCCYISPPTHLPHSLTPLLYPSPPHTTVCTLNSTPCSMMSISHS